MILHSASITLKPDGTVDDLGGEYTRLFSKDWDESKHPREPAGTSSGGEFAGVEAAPQPSTDDAQAAVRDFAQRTYERAGQRASNFNNEEEALSYSGLAYHLDLGGLNATRGAEIIAASDGKLTGRDVSRWASAWGRGSGGQDWAALQVAAGQKFGIPLGTAEGRVATLAPSEEDVAAARPFVDAVYKATQDYLSQRGIDFVNLYRGVGYTDASAPETYQQARVNGEATGHIPTKPLQSYGIDPSVTEQFGTNFQGLNPAMGSGGRPYTLSVRVPRARIFGMSYVGIGVPREGEYVITGGPTVARVTARRSQYGN